MSRSSFRSILQRLLLLHPYSFGIRLSRIFREMLFIILRHLKREKPALHNQKKFCEGVLGSSVRRPVTGQRNPKEL
jgi:hypothetical protein